MLIDLISLAWSALAGHRVRTALGVLGVAVGIAVVVALTTLGERARQYVIQVYLHLKLCECKEYCAIGRRRSKKNQAINLALTRLADGVLV
jgi:hypothetical protein